MSIWASFAIGMERSRILIRNGREADMDTAGVNVYFANAWRRVSLIMDVTVRACVRACVLPVAGSDERRVELMNDIHLKFDNNS
jgi:hypothetical protein